jgi:hypothetical protein
MLLHGQLYVAHATIIEYLLSQFATNAISKGGNW